MLKRPRPHSPLCSTVKTSVVRWARQGRARAREVYDWAHIIPQYENLWAELNEERKHTIGSDFTKASWSARPDPFAAFEAYPTHILTEESQLEATVSDVATLCESVEAMRTLAMVNFAKVVLPTPEEVRLVLTCAIAGPSLAVDLVRNIPQERRGHVFRSLGWFLKLGILRIIVSDALKAPKSFCDRNQQQRE